MYVDFLPVLLVSFISLSLLATFIGGFLGLWIWYKSKEAFKKNLEKGKELEFFKVSVPEDTEVEIKAMEQFYTSLMGIKEVGRFGVNKSPNISLEIVGSSHGIDFYVVTPKKYSSLVEKAIHAVYSDAEIDKGKHNLWSIWEQEGYQEFDELYLAKEDYYPLKTYEETELDPLNSITSSMSKMSEGEGMALQIVIRPATNDWKDIGNSVARHLTNKKDKDGNPKSTDADREKAEVIKSKTKKEGMEFVIRAFSVAPTKEIAKANLKNLKNSLNVLSHSQGNRLSSKKYPFPFSLFDKARKREFLYAFIYRMFPYVHIKVPYVKKVLFKGYSVLNTAELATLYHFPTKQVKTPGINWLRSKANIAPFELPESGTYLGLSEFRGVEKKVYMLEDDRRRHLYVLGQTGTGKSEFLKFLAVQDIKAGKGLAFMDPHGSAVRDILQQVPKERIKDVIYFNPGDKDYPMGLNILEAETEREKNLVVNSFIALLYKLYDPNRQGIVGPRLERAVRNAMLTIMSEPGNTLIEVMRVLMDEKYQKEMLPKIKDPLVKSYWVKEIAQTTAHHKSEVLGYFVSKFDRFATESVMRNIIGQSKSAFDFSKVMKEKKILLIDLNKGAIGEENSKFLGLLLVPRILSAAFRRMETEENFDDFYLYVDEFQNFATPDFVTILSEARKYKLNLIVANQFLSQMPEDIKGAIFGNVGTLVSFRVGQDDAKYMAEQFHPRFTENDLLNLPVGRTVTRLLVKGHPTPPFSMKTDWPLIQSLPRSPEVANEIIENSRRLYAKPVEEVEKEIKNRGGLKALLEDDTKKPSPFGSRPSSFGSAGSFASSTSKSSSSDSPFSKLFGSRSSSSSKPSSGFGSSFGSKPSSLGRPSSSFSAEKIDASAPKSSGSSTLSNKPSFGSSFGSRPSSLGKPSSSFGSSFGSSSPSFSKPPSNKRGAISLADLEQDTRIKKPSSKDYIEPKNAFNTGDKVPPRPKPKGPVVIEKESKKPTKKEGTDPKGQKTIALE